MLGAFCSITGGQRDFFWFPKFSKKKTKQKQTNLFLIPLNFLSGSLTCRIQRNFTWIELISKLSPHSCKPGGISPFALIAAHSHFEPKVLTRNNRKDKNASLRFSLETMKGTTGQKQRPKANPKNESPAAFARGQPRLRPSSVTACLDSFQSKWCARIWHDKTKREWSNSNLEFNCRPCGEF